MLDTFWNMCKIHPCRSGKRATPQMRMRRGFGTVYCLQNLAVIKMVKKKLRPLKKS
jgi:hypothetical protein